MFLLTLRFYATGGMMMSIGDMTGVSVSTVSKVVTLVSHHIALMKDHFIHMPENEEEIVSTRNKFFSVAKFPRVIGALDCTHVKIQSPGKCLKCKKI